MLKFIKNLFSPGNSTPKGFEPEVLGDERDLPTFVKYVVCSLVDSPSDVSIDTDNNEKYMNIKITCKKEDIGKIIGKSGKTIEAIRALVNGAAGRLGKKANVEVVD